MNTKYTGWNSQDLLAELIKHEKWDAIHVMCTYTILTPNKLYGGLPNDIVNMLYNDEWTERIFQETISSETSGNWYKWLELKNYCKFLNPIGRTLSSKTICKAYTILEPIYAIQYVNSGNFDEVFSTLGTEIMYYINDSCNIDMNAISIDGVIAFLTFKTNCADPLRANITNWLRQHWNILYDIDISLLISWKSSTNASKLIRIKLITDGRYEDFVKMAPDVNRKPEELTEDEYVLMVELGRTSFIKKYITVPTIPILNRLCELGHIECLPNVLEANRIRSIMLCQNIDRVKIMLNKIVEVRELTPDEVLQLIDSPKEKLMLIKNRLPALQKMWNICPDINIIGKLYELPHDFIHTHLDDNWVDFQFSKCCHPFLALRTEILYKNIPHNYLITAILMLLCKEIGTMIDEFVPVPEITIDPILEDLENLYDDMPVELATYYLTYLAAGLGIDNNKRFIVDYLLSDPGALSDMPNIYTFPNSEEGYDCMRALNINSTNKFHMNVMYNRDDLDQFKRLSKSYISEGSLSIAISKKAKKISQYVLSELLRN